MAEESIPPPLANMPGPSQWDAANATFTGTLEEWVQQRPSAADVVEWWEVLGDHPLLRGEVAEEREKLLALACKLLRKEDPSLFIGAVPSIDLPLELVPRVAEAVLRRIGGMLLYLKPWSISYECVVTVSVNHSIERLIQRYPRLHIYSPGLEEPHIKIALDAALRFRWEAGAIALSTTDQIPRNLFQPPVHAEVWIATRDGGSAWLRTVDARPCLKEMLWEDLDTNYIIPGPRAVAVLSPWNGATKDDFIAAAERAWKEMQEFVGQSAGKQPPNSKPRYRKHMGRFQEWWAWQEGRKDAVPNQFIMAIKDRPEGDALWPSDDGARRNDLKKARRWLDPGYNGD